ncbi:hypothetical protein NIES2111_16170 [Nostoc sp. NIES-2111]|nr:hypothetical protein NIES2111_16170 [Nostoc sp. NIES-2111]
MRKQKTDLKLTEAARLELTFFLAANPSPEQTTEAYLQWLVWCLQWRELSKSQALEVVEASIHKLTELKTALDKH